MVKNGEQISLMGEYTNKIVSGHRIVLPSALRKGIGTSFIITKGYEGCILIVPKKAWTKLVSPMESRSFLDRNVRDSLRFLAGGAYSVSLDAQGRVVVPETLRTYSHIQFNDTVAKEVVFVGLMNWVEVWEGSKWNEHNAMITQNADQIAEKLLNSNQVQS